MNHFFLQKSLRGIMCIVIVSCSLSKLGAQGVTYQDTSLMLNNYLRKTDTSTMLKPYLRKSDTAKMLSGYIRLQNTQSSVKQAGKIFVSDSIRTNGVFNGGRIFLTGNNATTTLSVSNGGTAHGGLFQTASGRALFAINASSSVFNPTLFIKNFGTAGLISASNGSAEIMTLGNNGELKTRSLISDTLKSATTNGGALYSDAGKKIMTWGASSANKILFYGSAGYDANRSATYTAQSFVDKNYVDSALLLRIKTADVNGMLGAYLLKSDTAKMLQGYARNTVMFSMLNAYVPRIEMPSFLQGYAKTTDVNGLLVTYLQKTDTAQMLQGYMRNSALGSVLTSYLPRTELPTVLQSYARITDVNGLLLAYLQKTDTAQMLQGYVRNNALGSVLTSYLPRTELPSMLVGYAKTTDVNGLLGSYLQKTDTSQMLQGYVRNGALSGFATASQLQQYLSLTGGTLSGMLSGTEARFSGNMYVKKLVVAPASWSDFVFDKSYQLRPLQEVENFIQQHHHLPDVPSAKEVAEKGISVGENQALLLQKVEELTLYIIQQNKRIAALEQALANKPIKKRKTIDK